MAASAEAETSACVAEIAAFEATKPALVLALPNTDRGIAERLKAGLAAVGFASVDPIVLMLLWMFSVDRR